MAATQLIEAVREHRPAFQSQVFRELLRLRRGGAIRKIFVAKGYVADGDTRLISLFCDCCMVLTGIAADDLFDELDALARARGFRPETYIVETAGTCEKCAHAESQ